MASDLRIEQPAEFSTLKERLDQVRADLDAALEEAEHQRDLIAKLRAEVEAICELTSKSRRV